MQTGVTPGSNLEPEIGFSRAVRRGDLIAVSGTAPIGDDGKTVGIGNVYIQTQRCIAIMQAALIDAGSSIEDVVRTRVMLTDATSWREAARAWRGISRHPAGLHLHRSRPVHRSRVAGRD